MTVRMGEQYVANGALTQAGYSALRGTETAVAALQADVAAALADIAAIETATSFTKLQTAIVAASQTEMNWTGVPAWVNRITVMGVGLSTNGTSGLVLRVGDGAIVSAGYAGSVSAIPNGASPATSLSTNACALTLGIAATSVYRFTCQINRVTGNTWNFAGTGAFSDGATTTVFASDIALSGALDRVRITTAGGVNTFDAGTANISWE